MNAVAYVRVSSSKQLEGDGPDRQRANIAKFAALRFTVEREFVDDISGTKEFRPAFDEMLAYCAASGTKTVLVDKTDRFTRDLFVGLLLIATCAKAGLNVIDCSTGKSITQPENSIELFVVKQLMLIAELNKNLLVETMAAARQRIRNSGRKCEGRKGYRDLPAFNMAVQRAEQLREQRLTLREIAEHMNSESISTMTGRPWSHSAVHKMLRARLVLAAEKT